MSKVIIKDLNESKSMDHAAMSGVRGGLSIGAMVFQADQSQTIGGSASSNTGDITAVNAASFSPTTNIGEASGINYTELDIATLTGVANSGVSL